jgi:hypothetical protein
VTPVGRFLRSTHLDELPQLWNVLRGDMSIVGPRPERPEFIELLEHEVPFWSRRLLIKPGVTGWAQVCSGYAADCGTAAEKLSYDLWYLRHRSLTVDLAACLRTLPLCLELLDPRKLRRRSRDMPEVAPSAPLHAPYLSVARAEPVVCPFVPIAERRDDDAAPPAARETPAAIPLVQRLRVASHTL